MKCCERYCKQEAIPGISRCGFHMERLEERITAAVADLKKPTPNPIPLRKP